MPILVKSIEDIEDPVSTQDEDPDYMEVLSYKMETVRKALHLLPDQYRVILSLYLIEGFDHEEISQVLNISNNLSRTRYLRARRKLIENISSAGDSTIHVHA